MFAFVFLLLCLTQAVTQGETITPVYVNHRDPVTLTCPAGDQATTLKWTGPGGYLYVTGTTVEDDLRYDVKSRISASHTGGSYTLRITDFWGWDTGIYTCTVDGTVTIQMVIREVPPDFPEIENTVIVNGQNRTTGTEDRSMTLTCNSRSGIPVASVSWIKDGTTLATSANTIQYTKVFSRTDDRTVYTCQSSSTALTSTQTTSVLVYLDLKPGQPIISGQLSQTENNNQQLVCESTGSRPAAMIQWNIGGTWQSNNPKEVKVKESVTDTYTVTSTLSIPVTRQDNGKSVYCRASNQALSGGIESVQHNIAVMFGPGNVVITGNRVIVADGTNTLTLTCATQEYNRHVHITWYNGTTQIPNTAVVTNTSATYGGYISTQVLQLTPDRYQGGNVIRCVVQNEDVTIGQKTASVTLNLHYPPDIRVTYTNTTYTSPDRTFTCVPDGNPDTYQFCDWRHTSEDGTDIRQLTGSSRPTQSVLTLPEPGVIRRYEDTGYYICKVSNDIPDSSTYSTSSVFFVVEAPPVVDIPANTASVHGQIGKDVITTVEFYSRPAVSSSDVTWTRESKELLTRDTFVTSLGTRTIIMPFHGVNVHVKGYVAVLIINDLATEDLGDYKVTIENRVGIEHYTVSIISTGDDKLVSERTALIIASSIFSVVIITMVVIFIIFRVRQGRTNKRTNPETETNQRSGPDNSDSNENNQQSGYDDLNIVNISPPSVYEDIQNRGDSNASNQQSRYEDLNLVNVSPPSVYEDIQNRGDSNENNQQSGYEDLNLVNISPPSVYEDIQNRGDSNENNQQSGYEDMNLVNIRPPSVYEDIQNRE